MTMYTMYRSVILDYMPQNDEMMNEEKEGTFCLSSIHIQLDVNFQKFAMLIMVQFGDSIPNLNYTIEPTKTVLRREDIFTEPCKHEQFYRAADEYVVNRYNIEYIK